MPVGLGCSYADISQWFPSPGEREMLFSLLSWLGKGLSLERSDRERKDEGEAGWDVH